MAETKTRPNRRELQKAKTRQRIQEHAIRLFLERGFDETTVEDIVAAVGVSHMTFFRNFRTKEDVAVSDDYDQLIVRLVMERPAEEPLLERLRHALVDGMRGVAPEAQATLLAQSRLILDTPALHGRMLENQYATLAKVVAALVEEAGPTADVLTTRVVVAAALAAAATGLVAWVESDGLEPPALMVDRALIALRDHVAESVVGVPAKNTR